ncbi:DUF4132 domain-containing protein [Actinomadura barringtoniae]|uniref:DUF4132 domain-containing protein n=1 Tax=Actinomadura barringtoniae TaxID=1427535 RepID=A0A939TBX1_9ACTN|nr:DUF4132 domain-containing protein [Actinomadura barringtoniae]MBO2450640.1 DUF4132 domain-containing protein [Actinomadura barringtoniae]
MGIPDEDVLVLPHEWLRRMHPRRGGVRVPTAEVDHALAGEARTLAAESLPLLERVLGHPATGADLVARTRAHLAGEADPAGAAAVAMVAASSMWLWDEERLSGFVDVWVDDHGPAFAACAFAEYGRVVRTGSRHRLGPLEGIGLAEGPAAEGRWPLETFARRMRTFLATCPDDDYRQAVEALAGHRVTSAQRIMVAYLAPTRVDWVDECCEHPLQGAAEVFLQEALACALGTASQAETVGDWDILGWNGFRPGVVATLLDGVGEAAVPILTRALRSHLSDEDFATLTEALMILPSDAAFSALADRLEQKRFQPVVRAAMHRHPVRAARMLAPVACGPSGSTGGSGSSDLAAMLMSAHLRAYSYVLADLPNDVRERLRPISSTVEGVEEATPDEVPRFLAEPPWTRRRTRRKPFVLEGLPESREQRMAWTPGERERWGEGSRWWADYWTGRDDVDWDHEVARCRLGRVGPDSMGGLFAIAPEATLRPLLTAWDPDPAGAGRWMQPLISRFGLDALPLALTIADQVPAAFGGLLLPFFDAEVAWVMSDWLARLRASGVFARRWFARHGLDAVPLLLPAALDRPGGDRTNAEGALRLLAATHGTQPIIEAARAHGDDAAAAVGNVLAADPLEVLPSRVPKVGPWADPELLPPLLLREIGRALPFDAVRHVLTLLAMSKPGEPYAGIDALKQLCDPRSLAAFSWAVFQQWRLHGMPAKDGWALTQLGRCGDDETVRRLAPVIRAWPEERSHARAVAGLDVLAEIGTDVALMHLFGLTRKMRSKTFTTRVHEKISEVAAARGLSADQLADLAVPDFGLDADGGLTLDYGPRGFRVDFDERLRPQVTEENGRRRTDLPKPAASDDPVLAPAAKRRFSELKKEVRAVADEQIRRLEEAMVRGRRWSLEEFRCGLLDHPLIWHIARRLVWLADGPDGLDGADDTGGASGTAFRLAEDRTFADVEDNAFALLDGEAQISIAHPVRLGDDLEAWTEMFADYEILQPFDQLGRPVFTLTEEERRSGLLRRFEGKTAPYGRAKGLSQGRWSETGSGWIARELPGGPYVVVGLSPGIGSAGARADYPDQVITDVWLAGRPGRYRLGAEGSLTFGGLDPVTASEILHDLTRLTRDERN